MRGPERSGPFFLAARKELRQKYIPGPMVERGYIPYHYSEAHVFEAGVAESNVVSRTVGSPNETTEDGETAAGGVRFICAAERKPGLLSRPACRRASRDGACRAAIKERQNPGLVVRPDRSHGHRGAVPQDDVGPPVYWIRGPLGSGGHPARGQIVDSVREPVSIELDDAVDRSDPLDHEIFVAVAIHLSGDCDHAIRARDGQLRRVDP